MAANDETPGGITLDDYDVGDVIDLAWRALCEASRRMPFCYGRALWGEAECLLRTGWRPS